VNARGCSWPDVRPDASGSPIPVARYSARVDASGGARMGARINVRVDAIPDARLYARGMRVGVGQSCQINRQEPKRETTGAERRNQGAGSKPNPVIDSAGPWPILKPMRIAILLTAFTLFFGLTAPTRAQEAWLVPFAVGYRPELTGFREAFSRSSQNLPQPAENQLGWGIEIRSLASGFLLGPMYMRTWSDAESDSWRLRTESNALFGTLGYKLSPTTWLSVVPMLGVGGISQSLHLRARTGDLPLDTLLLGPGQDADIGTGLKFAGLASFELGLAFPTSSGSYGLSTRLGYIYSPLRPDWHLASGGRLRDAPTTGQRGPFVSIGLLVIPAPEVSTTRR